MSRIWGLYRGYTVCLGVVRCILGLEVYIGVRGGFI